MPRLIPTPRVTSRLLWALLLAVTIVFASGWQVAPAMPRSDWFRVDFAAHFFVFGLLATLLRRSFDPILTPRKKAEALAWGITSLFGLADELHQATNPVRVFDWGDFAMNSAGAAAALAVWRWWPLYRQILEWPLCACSFPPKIPKK